jgi:ATP-GRASP peptide maturase of grasp-with-spasm system
VQVCGINWESIDVIWYRRWMSPEEGAKIYVKSNDKADGALAHQINEFTRSENKALVSFFFNTLPSSKTFERLPVEEINKLSVLKKASELGIMIPSTYIITSKKDFNKIQKPLITKAINNVGTISVDGHSFAGYTTELNDLPEKVGDKFGPSLFQNLIDKKYEIRAFLLSGKFYSMAIFSQNDPQTSIDFRRYNHQAPNRTVPFNLPVDLEEKLLKLANHFNLRTGSFDLIKTTENHYVFLEINPGGQFGMVSYPCNYHLEKILALDLINFK